MENTRKRSRNLKEFLKEELNEEEISILKRAFDVIGDIAIIEIPHELSKKEKLIGETLLKLNKNIKVVCKKIGIHEGLFRTQKLEVIAGENRKETEHKENGLRFKLDVEKVYFSPRLGTERKRIAEQVKKGEDILVMFSGCAPYVCVLAKNTKARYVYGIEINPLGHNYGLENLKINKICNAFLINEDVKEAVPNFYQRILGLKSSIIRKDMDNRLKHNPNIIEIHTFESDFYENFSNLKKAIKFFKETGKYVFLHQPIDKKETRLNLTNYSIENEIYQKMIMLIKEFDINLIIHFCDCKADTNRKNIIKNIKPFKKYYNNVFFENSNAGYFFSKEDILNNIKQLEIKKVCIDTCHLLTFYDNKEMGDTIKEIQKHCDTYFHLGDYKNNVHAGKLDENSLIDLEKILPLVTKGVVEIISKDETKGEEMISSWRYLKNFIKTFDRILMPLPKSAGDFLDVALLALKRKGIIHFYDFLEEGKFNLAVDKIKNACEKTKRKFKILKIVKCGQFGPRIYRICVDAQIF